MSDLNHSETKELLKQAESSPSFSPSPSPSAIPADVPPSRSIRDFKAAVSQNEEVSQCEDEERVPQGEKLRLFMDGKVMQLVSALITIFALYGDDMRLVGSFKNSDPLYYFLFFLSLMFFTFELTVNVVVVEGYKWSFFFWLDMIATVSLVPDIQWIMQPILAMYGLGGGASSGNSSIARAGRASRAGTRAGRIVRLVRLVRLLRVVRLTKFFSTNKHSQLDDGTEETEAEKERQREQEQKEKEQREGGQAKKVEASRLGKILSEQTTRRVIIGVLGLMLVLPMIEVGEENTAGNFGLETLYWFGRSGCSSVSVSNSAAQNDSAFFCPGETPWISEEGWRAMLVDYAQQSRQDETSGTVPAPLLSIKVPDLLNGGRLIEIDEVTGVRCHPEVSGGLSLWETGYTIPPGGLNTEGACPPDDLLCCMWSEHASCSGTNTDNCPWRSAELKDVAYTPPPCAFPGSACEDVTVTAKFLTRGVKEKESMLSIIQTCFIVMLLAVGSLSISNDTQTLVIAPIEKMVNIVRQLADDPLRQPDVIDDEAESDILEMDVEKGEEEEGQLETRMLESTILKIGGLLQVGFGEAGAQIIGKNMSTGDGELDVLFPGRTVIAFYGCCGLRSFEETTECLSEEVMVFVNKIAKIIHTCSNLWGGSATQSSGDTFLLTWLFQDQAETARLVASIPQLQLNRYPEENTAPKAPRGRTMSILDAPSEGKRRLSKMSDESAVSPVEDRLGDEEEAPEVSPMEESAAALVQALVSSTGAADKDEFLTACESCEALTDMADRALISMIKVIAEVRRASDLNAYAKHPKIIPRFGLAYKVDMSLSLHMGWSIEGAVGSEKKVDAVYISPHVKVAADLLNATMVYGTQLLFSDAVFQNLSAKAKDRCRKVDNVVMPELDQLWIPEGGDVGGLTISEESEPSKLYKYLASTNGIPFGLYTFDVNAKVVAAPPDHQMGSLVPPAEIAQESLDSRGVDWMFLIDQDVVQLQEGINLEFQTAWRQGFHYFLSGHWTNAIPIFQRCNQIRSPEGDGPSKSLLAFIQENADPQTGNPEERFIGYRDLPKL